MDHSILTFCYGLHLKGQEIPVDNYGDYVFLPLRVLAMFDRWREAQQNRPNRFFYLSPTVGAWIAAESVHVKHYRLDNLIRVSHVQFQAFQDWLQDIRLNHELA